MKWNDEVSDAETSSAQAPQAMKEEAKAGNKKQDLNFRATKFLYSIHFSNFKFINCHIVYFCTKHTDGAATTYK